MVVVVVVVVTVVMLPRRVSARNLAPKGLLDVHLARVLVHHLSRTLVEHEVDVLVYALDLAGVFYGDGVGRTRALRRGGICGVCAIVARGGGVEVFAGLLRVWRIGDRMARCALLLLLVLLPRRRYRGGHGGLTIQMVPGKEGGGGGGGGGTTGEKGSPS